MAPYGELGEECLEFSGRKSFQMGRGLEGGGGLEGDWGTGEGFNLREELRVEGETQIGEGAELLRIFRIVGSQHSGGSGGGFE